MELAGEITNYATRGLKNGGQSFTNLLAHLLTVVSAQGVSQVVGIDLIGNLPNLGTELSALISIFY